MLSHRNITWTARIAVREMGALEDDEQLCYLPLSHIAEQVVSLYVPMVGGGHVWFAESLDRFADNLREVRPTLFFGVPRVWEKIQATIQAAGATSGGLKRRIATWARGLGLAGGYAEQRGEPRRCSTHWPTGWSSRRCGPSWDSIAPASGPSRRRR